MAHGSLRRISGDDMGSLEFMNQDELQQRVNDLYTNVNEENPTRAEESKAHYALRAVVDLHKPIETYNMNNVHKSWLTCNFCNDEIYPCPTIQAIEKELI